MIFAIFNILVIGVGLVGAVFWAIGSVSDNDAWTISGIGFMCLALIAWAFVLIAANLAILMGHPPA